MMRQMDGTAEMTFGWLDWSVLGAYLVVVAGIGIAVARRGAGASGEENDYFLASRRMPVWAVAISILATSQSAATFVGGPEQSYAGDLTYLFANVGALLAAVIVAAVFLPVYYRLGVTSVYELIGHRMGGSAQRMASGMFMLGRVFASGARLFIVAIPFSLIAFGSTSPGPLIMAIMIIACGATLYTMAGGIRAVIWTDVVQAVVYVGSIVIALSILLDKIPVSVGEVFTTLASGEDAAKLTLIETEGGFGRPYGVWAVLIGMTLFNVAAYGADQDLTQRMLTCRTPARGSSSILLANVIGWPVVGLFLVMGVLLYVYYHRPDIMGSMAPDAVPEEGRRVFIEFMLHEMPAGVRGLMLAGLFSAAMSSMDSALNAMTTTAVVDFARPSRQPDRTAERRLARRLTVVWAAALTTFAVACVFWQRGSGKTLIDFALGVMVFAYAGLLGVFVVAIFTRRGNGASVAAALAVGFVSVALLKDPMYARWAPGIGMPEKLAFPWIMVISTTLSACICMFGRRAPR